MLKEELQKRVDDARRQATLSIEEKAEFRTDGVTFKTAVGNAKTSSFLHREFVLALFPSAGPDLTMMLLQLLKSQEALRDPNGLPEFREQHKAAIAGTRARIERHGGLATFSADDRAIVEAIFMNPPDGTENFAA